jgi:hypothetical protein
MMLSFLRRGKKIGEASDWRGKREYLGAICIQIYNIMLIRRTLPFVKMVNFHIQISYFGTPHQIIF